MNGGILRYLQEQLHRNLPAEKGQALVGAGVGVVYLVWGQYWASLLWGGISHPVECLQTSTGDSPAFPALFAKAASELQCLKLFLSVLPCSRAAVFQVGSCRFGCLAILFSLFLHSSHVGLGHSSRSCCPGGRLCSYSNEVQKWEFCDYWNFRGLEAVSPDKGCGMSLTSFVPGRHWRG